MARDWHERQDWGGGDRDDLGSDYGTRGRGSRDRPDLRDDEGHRLGGYGRGADENSARRSAPRQDRGYGYGYGRGSGPISDERWDEISERDFSNDWGTGVGDMYDRGNRWGSRRDEPGFPSYGRGGGGYGGGDRGDWGRDEPYRSGWNRDESDRGSGRGRSGRSAYGGSYGASREGYETDRPYRGGDYRGRQGAFIGQGGDAGAPTDHSDWSHETGSGYSGGGRREDRGWFGGPTGNGERRPSWQSQGEHRGRGPRGYQRSDERIREDVNDRLSEDHDVDASDITVEVSGGEVTVSGTVDSRPVKRRVEDIVESVSGVRHCQNNLRIRSIDRPASAGDTTSRSAQDGGAGNRSGMAANTGGSTGAGQQAGTIATPSSATRSPASDLTGRS